jgi:hypothetical protein
MSRPHPAVAQQLGQFIEKQRLAAGFKSRKAFGEALARELDIEPSSGRVMASRWERGLRVPDPHQLAAVAKITNTPYEKLSELRAKTDGQPDRIAELVEAVNRLTEIVLERLPPADRKARGFSPRKRG